MHFDDTEELQEPKLICYRKQFIASRALIWSFVSVGAILFSVGYVLQVFTAHYPDDEVTALIFEKSGWTLIGIGAFLTISGIIACFHSCCIVLCYRPAPEKPQDKKRGSQRSNITNASDRSDKNAITTSLPISSNVAQLRHVVDNSYPAKQSQHILHNGGFYPVSTPPPPPQRSATSPKFNPIQDDSAIVPPWNQLRDSDKRRHKSQGNVQTHQVQQDWSDNERTQRMPPVLDKSPESGKNAHPYNDDLLLQQHLRKKLGTTKSEVVGGSSAISSPSMAGQGGYPLNQPRTDPLKIRAKPMFRVGPPVEKREPERSVWEHSSQQHSDSTTRSPLLPHRSTNSARHRQYFHEEHFTFSDFEPDDAFLPATEQPQPASFMASNATNAAPSEQAQIRVSNRSPIFSSALKTDVGKQQHQQQQLEHRQPQLMKHVYVNSNTSNLMNSPKSSHIIPTTVTSSSVTTVPVNISSPLTTAYLQHHHPRLAHQQHFSLDIDSNTPLHHQAPLSGGSTSSGRGSGSRGVETTPFSSFGHPGVPTSSVHPPAAVSVAMASPCIIRRVSPAMQRRGQSPSSGRSHEQTPEYSGPDQSSSAMSGPDIEMRGFQRAPNGRINFIKPIHPIPHRPAPETVAFNATFRSTVIKGQLPNQRQFSMGIDDEEDADNDNTSPDPEDAFPTPKKSPRRDRLMKAGETSRNVPPSTFVNVNERPLMASRNKSSPGIVSSSAFVSRMPAQDQYPTTQAFLCEREEII